MWWLRDKITVYYFQYLMEKPLFRIKVCLKLKLSFAENLTKLNKNMANPKASEVQKN